MQINKGKEITIVTLNPSIDRMYSINKLNIGNVQRSNSVSVTPGGKGLNVAKVCNILGYNANCIGFLGGFNGKFIENELRIKGIKTNYTYIDEETRVCLNLIDENGVSTEILERGPIVHKKYIKKFKEELIRCLDDTKILVVSGSAPIGISKTYYKEIGDICRERDIKYILDASGEFLELALESKPFLIKPNKDELENLIKKKINSKEDAVNAGKLLWERGPQNIAISLGKDGMVFVNKDITLYVDVPEIKVVNPVGSGDSSIAGFSYGFLNDYSIEETLKLANACGMSNATQIQTGYIDINQVIDFSNKINIIR